MLAAAQVMHAAGFRVVGDALVLDADASLPALACLLARLRCVASNRGHSGSAEFFPLPLGAGAGGAGTSSPYLVGDLSSTAIAVCKWTDVWPRRYMQVQTTVGGMHNRSADGPCTV